MKYKIDDEVVVKSSTLRSNLDLGLKLGVRGVVIKLDNGYSRYPYNVKVMTDHGYDNFWFAESDLDFSVNIEPQSKFNPLTPQEGGDHYKLRPIQPIEYSERNSLSMSQGNIVKYITRHKEKNGVEDLAKVVHYALLEAYFAYGEDGSTELKERVLKLLGENSNTK